MELKRQKITNRQLERLLLIVLNGIETVSIRVELLFSENLLIVLNGIETSKV